MKTTDFYKMVLPKISASKIKNYCKYEKAVKIICDEKIKQDYETIQNEFENVGVKKLKEKAQEFMQRNNELIKDAERVLDELKVKGENGDKLKMRKK